MDDHNALSNLVKSIRYYIAVRLIDCALSVMPEPYQDIYLQWISVAIRESLNEEMVEM